MEENNNIEKFFEKKFSDPITEEDWNTPPEDTWDNILEGLDEKSKKKRRFFFIPWLLGGLVLIMATYLFVSNETQNARIETLENKINERDINNNDQLKTLKDPAIYDEELSVDSNAEDIKQGLNDNTIIEKSQETASLTNNNRSNSSFKPSIKSNNINSTIDNNNIKENKKTVTNQKSSTTGKVNTSISTSQQSTEEINSSNVTIFTNESKPTSINIIPPVNNASILIDSNLVESLDFLNLLKLTQSLFPIAEREKENLDSLKGTGVNKSEKPLVYAGLILRQNNWIDRNSGLIDNPLEELLTQENTLSSFAYGLNTSLVVSPKWTANIGVLYNQRSHESTYLLHLPFSTNTETLDSDGEWINAFQHSLPTSLGDVQTDVTLARSQSSTISDNEIVDVDLSFKNQTRSILIPLSFSYFPKGVNEGIFFSTGFTNEIILSNTLSAIQSESHHDTVNDKSIMVQYSDDQQNRFGIAASAGLGYALNLKRDLNLSLSANYDFALSSNYVNNGYLHKIDNLSFEMRLMKVIKRK